MTRRPAHEAESAAPAASPEIAVQSQPSAVPAAARPDWSGWAAGAVLLLVALALYGVALRNPLVFDDDTLADAAALRAAAAFPPERPLRWLSQLSFGWTYAVAGADWMAPVS